MIDLLVASTIMRLKFKINYSNLVSCTCGKFLALIISHLCIQFFDHMMDLLVARTIMRSKLIKALILSVDLLINIIEQIRSHDRNFDLMKKLNFDLMKFDLMIISHLTVQYDTHFNLVKIY